MSAMGGNAAGALIQGLFGMGQDISNRAYERKANQRQRDHEVFMWHAQNAYNHPLQQRLRLEEAGLNPNLVYGNGSVANTADAPKVSQRSITPGQGLRGAGQAVGNFVEWEFQRKQQDMSQKALDIQQQNADSLQASREVSNAQKGVQTAKTAEDLRQAKDLYAEKKKAAELDNQLRDLRRANMEIENSNKDDLQKAALYEAYQRIRESASRVSVNDYEALIKQAQADLWKKGINPNDPTWTRILLDNLLPYLDQLKQSKNSSGAQRAREFHRGARSGNNWLDYNPFYTPNWTRWTKGERGASGSY